MASLLQLDNHSIIVVFSFLDASSLRNVLLTCKRLSELASDSRNWQTEIHRIRALYYLTDLCFDAKPSGVQEIVDRASKSLSDIRMVSDKMYDDTFEKCGPVVAKLFKMIKNTHCDVLTGEPRETCSTETNSFELHLPSGSKMNVSGSHFNDATGNYDREMTMTVYVDEKEYTRSISGSCCPTDAYYFPEEIAQFEEFFEALREPFNMIYKEIGETQPPLGPSFFYWFANIDWSCSRLGSFDMGEKYFFKNPESNKKAESSKSEMNKLREVTCNKWLETMESWKSGFCNTFAADIVVKTVGVLMKRNAEEVLGSLSFDLGRISVISTHMERYRHEVVKLMIRSTIFNPHPRKWTGSVADKYVQEYIAVKTNSGLLDISMSARDDGASYPCWLEFTLKYNLPNGPEYCISSTDPRLEEMQETEKRILSDEFYLKYSEMSKLEVLTNIFQEKVNAQYRDEKHLHFQLTNAFVLCYLVCAMAFDRYGCEPSYFPRNDLKPLQRKHFTDDTNSSGEEDDESDLSCG